MTDNNTDVTDDTRTDAESKSEPSTDDQPWTSDDYNFPTIRINDALDAEGTPTDLEEAEAIIQMTPAMAGGYGFPEEKVPDGIPVGIRTNDGLYRIVLTPEFIDDLRESAYWEPMLAYLNADKHTRETEFGSNFDNPNTVAPEDLPDDAVVIEPDCEAESGDDVDTEERRASRKGSSGGEN